MKKEGYIKNKPLESSFPFSLANFTAQYPWYILIRKSEPTIRAVVKGVACFHVMGTGNVSYS